MPASASGTQPPLVDLGGIAGHEGQVDQQHEAEQRADAPPGQFHSELATSAPSKVVISMVPTTDAP